MTAFLDHGTTGGDAFPLEVVEERALTLVTAACAASGDDPAAEYGVRQGCVDAVHARSYRIAATEPRHRATARR